MIYMELQLSGNVQIYELSDRLLLLKTTIQTRAECLPIPQLVEEAHEYMRAACYQLEMFESLDHAEAWAESYAGFRAGEVRAELARFQIRRASYGALGAVAA